MVYTVYSMRQIGIKELRKNLRKELNQLPFEVVRYEEVVAIVIPPVEADYKKYKAKVDEILKDMPEPKIIIDEEI